MGDLSEQASISESVERFLKIRDTPDGPFDLLGLGPDPSNWTPGEISRSLLDQLRLIDEHPQGRTPEADELRVALHVAAAQLRDPRVRASLADERGGSDGDAAESTADSGQPLRRPDPLEAPGAVEAGRLKAPDSLGVPPSPAASEDFRTAARHVLATCGGWNTESKRRLGYLARSASVDASGLQQTLVDITRSHERVYAFRPENGVPRADGGRDLPAAEPQHRIAPELSRSNYANRPLDHEPPDTRTRTWMTLGTVAMFFCSAAMAALLMVILIQRAVGGAAEVPTNTVVLNGLSTGSGGSSDAADPDPGAPAPEPEPSTPGVDYSSDPADVVRLVRTLDTEAFAAAPEESAAAFEEALARFSVVWSESDETVRSAAPLAFRDAVLAASEHDQALGARLIAILTDRLAPFDSSERVFEPKRIRSSVFCFGVAGMLIETPVLPREERALRSRLNSIASGVGLGVENRGFSELVGVALRVHAANFLPRAADSDEVPFADAWSAWADLSDTVAENERNTLKLDAIERLLLEGENPVFHSPTGEVLALLVNAVDWLGDPDRSAASRLLAWFDESQSIDTRALSVVTSELVDSALLPSLSARLKLSSSASAEERRRMRDQYAVRLGFPQAGDGRVFASEWAGYAQELLESSISQDHEDALNAALWAAWLNESAALWLSSDPDAARSALEKAKGSLPELIASSSPPVSFGGRQPSRADGEWAAEYLRARRSADDRTRLLYDLSNTGGPAGEADADVLAEAASYSTPIEVRRNAQRVVIDFSDRPAVVLGLLEVLPRAAPQDSVSEMIEQVTGRSLPVVTSQQWRLECRRALVARAMEILSGDEGRALDIAGTALRDSYGVRSDLLPPVPSDRAGSSVPPDMFQEQPGAGDRSAEPSSVLSEYCDRLHAQAQRYPERVPLFASLEEISSRRVWRKRLASTGLALFASEQTSCLEASAYIFGCERPSAAERISAIIGKAAERRRAAASVHEQIAQNEHAMLRLNLLRMIGGENP